MKWAQVEDCYRYYNRRCLFGTWTESGKAWVVVSIVSLTNFGRCFRTFAQNNRFSSGRSFFGLRAIRGKIADFGTIANPINRIDETRENYEKFFSVSNCTDLSVSFSAVSTGFDFREKVGGLYDVKSAVAVRCNCSARPVLFILVVTSAVGPIGRAEKNWKDKMCINY